MVKKKIFASQSSVNHNAWNSLGLHLFIRLPTHLKFFEAVIAKKWKKILEINERVSESWRKICVFLQRQNLDSLFIWVIKYKEQILQWQTWFREEGSIVFALFLSCHAVWRKIGYKLTKACTALSFFNGQLCMQKQPSW